METHGLTNTIYPDSPITYQGSNYYPIHGIYCSAPIAANWVVFLSFGILVEYHQSLWIEVTENWLLDFWQHYIIPPISRNLCLSDPRKINKFNDKLHTSFVKHDIYQKLHYIHSQAIYPLATHLAQNLEKLDTLITRLMHAADKNVEGK